MKGCLIWVIAFLGFVLFGGIIITTLGIALYIIEILLPVAIIVGIVLLIVKLVTGSSLKDIFSSKDKRHRYRRRK